MLLHLLASLVIGALSGAIANKIMNGNPKGFFQNALLGIVGHKKFLRFLRMYSFKKLKEFYYILYGIASGIQGDQATKLACAPCIAQPPKFP